MSQGTRDAFLHVIKCSIDRQNVRINDKDDIRYVVEFSLTLDQLIALREALAHTKGDAATARVFRCLDDAIEAARITI